VPPAAPSNRTREITDQLIAVCAVRVIVLFAQRSTASLDSVTSTTDHHVGPVIRQRPLDSSVGLIPPGEPQPDAAWATPGPTTSTAPQIGHQRPPSAPC